ncbi:PrsW family intramembrane metalloprotease [Frigoribacterium sp. CFBP 13729]|jgi:RsiW-degrading membrane proteinase PrsW (M82 family)|uniref:PrsW family intramembrane metalloprotease n=1 Tax=Frigoribacterium sp. CFBP 13729 TaxID=2775293 RepID=UPI00177D8689|nr:PrsW family intramembrane metalloprotease [Frigoribacterium sp. CFBP 13729]MBD8610822.1 PrsW family intramembrane metalloprotease [Frigoribacterium sp. CFBP 13729]
MTWDDSGQQHQIAGQPARAPEPVWWPAQPVFAQPAPRRRPVASGVALAVGFTVIGVFVLALVVYFLIFLSPGVILAASLLAFVPLAIVMVGIWLVDRWEPEPRVALLFAFLWGAAVSVGTALIVDLVVGSVQGLVGIGARGGAEVFGAVVQAPIVEEVAKGFGVLLVLWIFRRHFDGPVDGVVYAATVAAGFAFVENIQYFALQVVDDLTLGSDGLVFVFVVRALMSPFAHVMYTACTGIALGWAARRTGRLGAIGWFALGVVPAAALHALWNGALVVVGDGFFVYYLLVQVPIFVAMVLLVVFLRRNERRVTHARLAEYAAVGWFSADEVAMLSTGAGRRRARRWAAANGTGPAMRRFVSDATRLAFTRQRLVKGKRGHDEGARRDEADLLAALAASRSALQAPPAAFVGWPQQPALAWPHQPQPPQQHEQVWQPQQPAPLQVPQQPAQQQQYWQDGPPTHDPWGRPLPPPGW